MNDRLEPLLFVTPVMPAESGNGLAMRCGVFLAALATVRPVDVLALPIFGPPPARDVAFARRHARDLRILEPGAPDTHFGLISRLLNPDARLRAFIAYGRPSLVARFSAELIQRARDALASRSYGHVHVQRLYCAPFALALARDIAPGAPLTLDADEDDTRVALAMAAGRGLAGDVRAAGWWRQEACASGRLFAEHATTFARVFVSSPLDFARLRTLAPDAALEMIPNTAPRPAFPRPNEAIASLLFVGALGYQPNDDALRWFLARVWPRLRARRPTLRFDIVGAHASAAVRRHARAPGVRLHGFVADLRPVYARTTLVIAPIRTAAGTRIKLVEAAGHGVPIVSTSLGAEGLGLSARRDLWIADGPEATLRAVLDALDRPAERHRRARNARAHVARHFDPARTRAHIARSIAALAGRA